MNDENVEQSSNYLEFREFRFIFTMGTKLSPFHLLYRGVLHSSHLSLSRHVLWSFGDAYHQIVWRVTCFKYLGFVNHQFCMTRWKVSNLFPPQGVIQIQRSKRVHSPTCYPNSLKGSDVFYEGSHVLPVHLQNNNFHVT